MYKQCVHRVALLHTHRGMSMSKAPSNYGTDVGWRATQAMNVQCEPQSRWWNTLLNQDIYGESRMTNDYISNSVETHLNHKLRLQKQ